MSKFYNMKFTKEIPLYTSATRSFRREMAVRQRSWPKLNNELNDSDMSLGHVIENSLFRNNTCFNH